MDVVPSAECLVVKGSAGAGGVAAPGLVRLTLSCSVVWTKVAAGSEVMAGEGIPGFWVEISVSGGGVTSRDVDGDTSVSLVVSIFSDVTDSLVVVVETAVDTVAVVRVGTGSGAVMVVSRETAAVVSARSVVLTVVTDSADVATVVDGTPDMVVVPGLGVTVGGLRVVDLVVTAGGLVAMVTLAVTGLIVDL